MDASVGSKGDYSDLVSPSHSFNGTACLSIAVHMFGDFIGAFEVYISDRVGAMHR